MFSPEQMAELLQCRARITELAQALATATTRHDELTDALMEHLEDRGKNAMRLHGYRVRFVPGQPAVPWEKEFRSLVRPEELERVLAAAPKPPTLRITCDTPTD